MGGRRYNIFISSTFKDMDAERDVIKYDVISLLNDRYRQYGVEFHAVDLRFGVNTENMTEEDSENAVLDVCLSMIDSSRPFFIGLIGDRYGWIPKPERMNSVLSRLSQEKRNLLIEGTTCSVTELEILYAALCDDNGRNSDRCLFMARNAESYEGLSDDLMAMYSDGCSDRLQSLKDRVHEILKARGQDELYIPYTLKWNPDRKCFEGLSEFCRLVFDNLCEEIDDEITDLAKPLSWYEVAQSTTEFRVDNNCAGTVDLYGVDSIIERLRNSSRLLISGRQGIGKSVLVSQIYRSLGSNANIYPLLSMIGITPEACILNNIFFMWIREMEENLSLEYTPESILDDKSAYKRLYDRFYELVDIYGDRGIKIVCLLDNFSSVAKGEYDLSDLLWVRGDVDVAVTCENHSKIYQSLKESIQDEICLDDLDFDINKLVVSHENSTGIMLPARVEQLMDEDNVTPLQVRLFMSMVSNLTTYDFTQIRSIEKGSDIEKINNYIINLYLRLPKGTDMLRAAVDFIAERMSAPWLDETITYLATSRTGLRECDLSNLAGKQWDPLKFTVFMNIFRDFFSLNQMTKVWKLDMPEFCDALYSRSHARKICRLADTYPNEDTLKQSYMAYYALLSSDVEAAQKYLCSETALNPRGEKDFWSSDSVSMLRYDDDRLEMVSELMKGLSPVSQVRLIFAIMTEVPLLHRVEWFAEFAAGLTGFSDRIEGPADLYALAWILNDAALHIRHSQKYQADYEALVDGACMAYKKCYEKDPTYKDVKNMYKVAMMCKADMLCEKGDFDAAMEIFKSITY